MLSDRNYYGNYRENREANPSRISFLLMIIFANIAVYLLQGITPVDVPVRTPLGIEILRSDRVTESFALVSTRVARGELYRMLTYMFLHGGFGHILFNMWGLYLFGSTLEARIGAKRFLALYLFSGLLGACFWLFFNWGTRVPCIGASGALFGVILATAMFYPDMPIMLLFPPIPMKLRTFAIVYVCAEIFFEMSNIEGNVAHIVHLGGGLGGYLFAIIFYREEVKGFFPGFSSRKRRNKGISIDHNGWTIVDYEERISQKEVDRLLDKISMYGINSLTEEELETLRRAREEMMKR